MKRLMISGACGRMGTMLAHSAGEAGFAVAAGVDSRPREGLGFPVFTDYAACDVPLDLIIDFSSPSALTPLLDYALKRKLPLLLGATGYADEHMESIRRASRDIPVFQSSNMSQGVYALRLLAAQASRLLPGFDIEIVEKHHSKKADAPSGTALSLYDAVKGPESIEVFGREGRNALRQPKEIGLHAVRGGTVAGEHEAGFYGRHESIRLTHIAESREVFVSGALAAAGWLTRQRPGLYGMQDYMNSLKETET